MCSVEQYQWIVSWLEKNKLYKTLDALLEEGSEIASESFGLCKTVEVDVRATLTSFLLALSPEACFNFSGDLLLCGELTCTSLGPPIGWR